jgi:GTP-binding protein
VNPSPPPRVVIVGFPNAGKSTLFNRLARQKKALVHSRAGMTRDQVTTVVRLEDRPVELVDTGGFLDSPDEPLSPQVKAKAWGAARSAAVIILVLDGRRGLIPAEEELYGEMRKLDRPLVVAVNKIDTEADRIDLGDYYRLGADPLLFISAEHALGIQDLKEAVVWALPAAEEGPAAAAAEAGEPPLKIALIGRVNVGKSSLANRLAGEDRFIVNALPGTTRDSSDVLVRRKGRTYQLIDTAGIRKMGKVADERESAGVIKARKNIPQADVLCLVLDVLEFPTRQDAAVAKIAAESGKPLVIVLNKWDRVREEDVIMAELERALWSRLDFVHYAPLVPVSAATGQRVWRILDLAVEVHANAQKTVSTAQLNRFAEALNASNPPITDAGRRFRIKYMTQTGVLPPSFSLYANTRSGLAPAYEKFMTQKMRELFGFDGTPVRVYLKASAGPRKRA